MLSNTPVSTPLRLSIGACSLSSTTKPPWANEDAQFVAGNYCGVFDGVSALPASRAYARQLSGLTRSALCRIDEGAVLDVAAWKRTAVNALQAAARGAKSLDGASTACLVCVDLERRQLSTYVLGDSGWLLFAPSASGRRLCARSSPQLHRVGAPVCPRAEIRPAHGEWPHLSFSLPGPGCSPKCRARRTPLVLAGILAWRCCSDAGLGHAGAPWHLGSSSMAAALQPSTGPAPVEVA